MRFTQLLQTIMWKWFPYPFDEYQSIFGETIRKDQIVTPTCFVETKGESSGIFKKYRLGRGFTNYLLDDMV